MFGLFGNKGKKHTINMGGTILSYLRDFVKVAQEDSGARGQITLKPVDADVTEGGYRGKYLEFQVVLNNLPKYKTPDDESPNNLSRYDQAIFVVGAELLMHNGQYTEGAKSMMYSALKYWFFPHPTDNTITLLSRCISDDGERTDDVTFFRGLLRRLRRINEDTMVLTDMRLYLDKQLYDEQTGMIPMTDINEIIKKVIG